MKTLFVCTVFFLFSCIRSEKTEFGTKKSNFTVKIKKNNIKAKILKTFCPKKIIVYENKKIKNIKLIRTSPTIVMSNKYQGSFNYVDHKVYFLSSALIKKADDSFYDKMTNFVYDTFNGKLKTITKSKFPVYLSYLPEGPSYDVVRHKSYFIGIPKVIIDNVAYYLNFSSYLGNSKKHDKKILFRQDKNRKIEKLAENKSFMSIVKWYRSNYCLLIRSFWNKKYFYFNFRKKRLKELKNNFKKNINTIQKFVKPGYWVFAKNTQNPGGTKKIYIRTNENETSLTEIILDKKMDSFNDLIIEISKNLNIAIQNISQNRKKSIWIYNKKGKVINSFNSNKYQGEMVYLPEFNILIYSVLEKNKTILFNLNTNKIEKEIANLTIDCTKTFYENSKHLLVCIKDSRSDEFGYQGHGHAGYITVSIYKVLTN